MIRKTILGAIGIVIGVATMAFLGADDVHIVVGGWLSCIIMIVLCDED